MHSRKDRLNFARSRPLPAFGVLLDWTIQLLRLTEWEGYEHSSLSAEEGSLLAEAIEQLSSSSFKNVACGLIVKEDTKRKVCSAFSTCLRNMPVLPFRQISNDEVAEAVRALWSRHEQISGLCSGLTDGPEFVLNAFFRQATVEFAIRAGAISSLMNDTGCPDDVPIWSKHKELKRHLRDLAKMAAGSREKLSHELGRSDSEVDGWVYELDSPAPPDLRKWEELLAVRSTNQAHSAECHHLWRLYAGIRLWTSAGAWIPEPLKNELLRKYCQIKRRVVAFFSLDRKTSDSQKQHHLAFLALTGRVTTRALLASLTASEADILWIRHIEAAAQVEDYPTSGILALAEFYSNAAFGFEEGARISGIRFNQSLDDFLRECMRSSASSGPMAASMRLYEAAMKYQSNGDLEQAASCVEEIVRLQPSSPASWNSMARTRFAQRRYQEAEQCYRKSLEIWPDFLDSRAGLALLLALNGRAEEALIELETKNPDDRNRPEWIYAHGLSLLKIGQIATAKKELLKCVEMAFKMSACYHWLAEACEQLGQAAEARQFRKQAQEIEGPEPIR